MGITEALWCNVQNITALKLKWGSIEYCLYLVLQG